MVKWFDATLILDGIDRPMLRRVSLGWYAVDNYFVTIAACDLNRNNYEIRFSYQSEMFFQFGSRAKRDHRRTRR